MTTDVAGLIAELNEQADRRDCVRPAADRIERRAAAALAAMAQERDEDQARAARLAEWLDKAERELDEAREALRAASGAVLDLDKTVWVALRQTYNKEFNAANAAARKGEK